MGTVKLDRRRILAAYIIKQYAEDGAFSISHPSQFVHMNILDFVDRFNKAARQHKVAEPINTSAVNEDSALHTSTTYILEGLYAAGLLLPKVKRGYNFRPDDRLFRFVDSLPAKFSEWPFEIEVPRINHDQYNQA